MSANKRDSRFLLGRETSSSPNVSLSFLSILDGQSIAIDRSAGHTTFLVHGNRSLKGKDCIRPCLPAIREDRKMIKRKKNDGGQKPDLFFE